jgi:hypothetical protein
MEEKLKYKIRSTVEMLGLDQSLNLFGKDTIKQVYVDNPQSYLDNFKEITIVEDSVFINYMDKRGKLVFFISIKKISSMDKFIKVKPEIFDFFLNIIDQDFDDTRKIINDWLKINFNLDSPILFIY